ASFQRPNHQDDRLAERSEGEGAGTRDRSRQGGNALRWMAVFVRPLSNRGIDWTPARSYRGARWEQTSDWNHGREQLTLAASWFFCSRTYICRIWPVLSRCCMRRRNSAAPIS